MENLQESLFLSSSVFVYQHTIGRGQVRGLLTCPLLGHAAICVKKSDCSGVSDNGACFSRGRLSGTIGSKRKGTPHSSGVRSLFSPLHGRQAAIVFSHVLPPSSEEGKMLSTVFARRSVQYSHS